MSHGCSAVLCWDDDSDESEVGDFFDYVSGKLAGLVELDGFGLEFFFCEVLHGFFEYFVFGCEVEVHFDPLFGKIILTVLLGEPVPKSCGRGKGVKIVVNM